MRIGVPKERKDNENRVGMKPGDVETLTEHGHTVLVEEDAGSGSGFSNESYEAHGAELVDAATAWDADLVVKIKEPLEQEYQYLDADTTLFTYFHLAADERLTREVLDSGMTAIAYETVRQDGELPLLDPMSEVAGKMAALEGTAYLAEHKGGKGVLLPGLQNVAPANVLVIGGGTVGTNAADLAARMGADVTILDIDEERITELNETLPDNVTAAYSDRETIESYLPDTDVLVGAVLVPGGEAPTVVTEDDVAAMEPGSVIVDVAVDQGGCVETTRPTSHSDPVYEDHGVIHYAVTNMPGAYARTATYGITNATLPYITAIAEHGWRDAMREDESLRYGLNAVDGTLTNEAVADAFGLDWTPVDELL